jgi:hypothetical protein
LQILAYALSGVLFLAGLVDYSAFSRPFQHLEIIERFSVPLYRSTDTSSPFTSVPLLIIILSLIMWLALSGHIAYKHKEFTPLVMFGLVLILFGVFPPPPIDAPDTLYNFIKFSAGNGVECFYSLGIYSVLKVSSEMFFPRGLKS